MHLNDTTKFNHIEVDGKERGYAITLGLRLCCLAFVFTGCDAEGDQYAADKYSISYGAVIEIDEQREGLTIKIDDGSLIIAVSALVPYNGLEVGDRVKFNYTVMYKEGNDYIARINNYDKLTTKKPFNLSTIDGELQAYIGYDAIIVNRAWLSGKYINIEYSVLTKKNSKVTHLISLVNNDFEHNSQAVVLSLHHNAYEDAPEEKDINDFEYTTGFISFDILSQIERVGGSKARINLEWRDYNSAGGDTYKGSTGVFTPYTYNVEMEKLIAN